MTNYNEKDDFDQTQDHWYVEEQRRLREHRFREAPILSTHAAFKPGTEHFGSGICPAIILLAWDDAAQEWFVVLEGPGAPVIRSKSKETLEQFMDWVVYGHEVN